MESDSQNAHPNPGNQGWNGLSIHPKVYPNTEYDSEKPM